MRDQWGVKGLGDIGTGTSFCSGGFCEHCILNCQMSHKLQKITFLHPFPSAMIVQDMAKPGFHKALFIVVFCWLEPGTGTVLRNIF